MPEAAPTPDPGAPSGPREIVRRLAVTALTLLVVGAVWLVAVRGEAILVDLSVAGSKVFCF